VAILYVLALLFSAINAQAIYYTGDGANGTFTNTDNWSGNVVPGSDSIVYINDTGCYDCYIEIDTDITISELHLDAFDRYGARLRINAGATLTITKVFNYGNLGKAGATYNYLPTVIFRDGTLVIGTGATGTWYYGDVYTGYPIYPESTYGGRLVNNGTITIKTNTGETPSTSNYFYVGYSSIYTGKPFIIDNSGTWVVDDPNGVRLVVQNAWWNHWSGSFNSTYYTTTAGTTTTYPTIYFDNTDVVFQSGSADTTWFNGPIYFDSDNSASYWRYPTSPAARVIVNTTNFALSWAEFHGVNVLFNYDGWIKNSNFTNYATLNTTITDKFTSVILSGTNRVNYGIFTAIDGPLRVLVDYGSKFYPDEYFTIVGPVKFFNNGTVVSDSAGDWYWHPDAWFVNLGLWDLTTLVYFYSSQYPDNTYHDIGTFVNRGTVSFTKSGGYLYYSGSGTGSGKFLQCEHGVLKYTYGATTTSSASTFFQLSLDGYIGVNFEKDYKTISQTLFYWDEAQYADTKYSKKGVFVGDVTEFTNGPGTVATPQILCADGDFGYLYLYNLFDGSCSKHGSKYTNSFNDPPTGGVCKALPDEINFPIASCPASKNCGIDTGKPIGESDSASSLPVSLALLVSLIGFLFYQH
jgi:hypothetical protein